MSHRISFEEAEELRKYELECQELSKKGVKPKISRSEKKRLMRLSKSERFVEMLKKRGGYFKQKEEV